jgi:homotetrameric cytidine deaminase
MNDNNQTKNWQAELITAAIEAQKFAYVPYSGIKVGAALLSADGAIFDGCNIENAAYSPTLCAERTAFAKAISYGQQDFQAIAVVGSSAKDAAEELDYFYPCGVCRQWLAEFCAPDFVIIVAKSPTDYLQLALAELLPHSFGPGHLK